MSNINPFTVLKESTTEQRGNDARYSLIESAVAVGTMLKSTLGPYGMDKVLHNSTSTHVTNDGATIMKGLSFSEPGARILVDVSRSQDSEVGDGTTGVVVLASELLRESQKLLGQGLHPQTILRGFVEAEQIGKSALLRSAKEVDEKSVKDTLLALARTTLSSKVLNIEKEHFADLCASAVMRLGENKDLELIHVLKLNGAGLKDSFLDDGFILPRSFGSAQKKSVENARILLSNCPMDSDRIKVFGTKIKAKSLEELIEVERAEKQKMSAKVELIKAYNANVFINRQLIYDYPEQLLVDAGISTVDNVNFEGVRRLARVLGADVVSMFDDPKGVVLGTCSRIEEIEIGTERVLRFSGVKLGQACTIVLRGGSQQLLDEAERAVHDVLCVLVNFLKEPSVVYGGGCIELTCAAAIEEAARAVGTKHGLAMEAFAKALRALPCALADNAGLDGTELVTKLRSKYAADRNCTWGIDFTVKSVGDVSAYPILEIAKSKLNALSLASEAAQMIVKADGVVKCRD